MRESMHHTQVRTKPKEEEQYQETQKTADPRRLMADPKHLYQVTNAMVAALPLIPDGICISDIATDRADVLLSTAAELAPRSNRPRGAQGCCAGSGVEAEMNAAWQQR